MDFKKVLSYLTKIYNLRISNEKDGRFLIQVYKRGTNKFLMKRCGMDLEDLIMSVLYDSLWSRLGEYLFSDIISKEGK